MKKFKIGIIIIILIITGFITWYNAINKNVHSAKIHIFKIGLTPWIGDGVYFVAQEKKFFEKEKINVEFVNIDDSATGRQLLKAEKLDAFVLTPETIVILNDAGVKIKIIAATDLSAGADGIIAAKDIKTIEDLKGKKVAFEVGSPSHFYLSYLLNQKGLSTADLEVVDQIASDAGASFVAGKVDAAVTWEPWLTKAKERAGGHLLASSKDTPVVFDMPILSTAVVKNHNKDVRAMMRAVFSAQKWISNHKPEETAKIIAGPLKITPQDALDQMKGVHWLSYEENLNKLTSGTYSVINSIQLAGNLWKKLGLIKKDINAVEIVDPSILKNLYNEK